MRRFANYQRFVNNYFEDHLLFDSKHYFYSKQIEVASLRIAILGLNSAWLSGSDQDRNQLVLGEQQVRTVLKETKDADLRLALMHHHFDNLHDFDRADVEPLLLGECDFVLRGHMHMPMQRPSLLQTRTPDAKAMVITAGAGYTTRQYPHAYNFVRLDLNANKGSIYLRTYSERGGGFWTKDVTARREAPEGIYTFPLHIERLSSPKDTAVDISILDKICVKELDLTNFRCFEKDALTFSEECTILVGNNASGKTTILEALVIGIGAFFAGIDLVPSPHIEPDQIRLLQYKHGETITYETQYPVQIRCQGTWGNQELEWVLARGQRFEQVTDQRAEKLVGLARHLQSQVQKGESVVLPLIAYYSTGRLWRAPRRSPNDIDSPGSRFRGYEKCLDPASHIGGLVQWMKTQELIALQEGKSDQIYEAVKKAIKNCVENLESVTFRVREDEVYTRFNDGQEFPFRMLSEGVRNMLAMVADIAYRAAILNPQFGKDATAKTPGIVLIDEIDLHLHPRWQRRVVEDLRRTFPRMQFIATTHSPFIIQSLRPGELIDLHTGPTGEYANRSIEDITEDVMGIPIPQRSERYNQMFAAAQEYYRVLEQAEGANPEEINRLKQKLDELVEPFSDNVAYHAFLQMERLAAGLDGDNDNEAN